MDYLTVRPVARKGYGLIAHEAKPNGLLARGPCGRRVSKCKLKKYLFGNKTKESVTLFASMRTIVNSPLVA